MKQNKKKTWKRAWNEWQSKKRKYKKLYDFVSGELYKRRRLFRLWQKHKNAKIIFMRRQAESDAKLPFWRRFFMRYKRDYDRMLGKVDTDTKHMTTADWIFIGVGIILVIDYWLKS